MELKSLILGLIFSLAIFAVKSGAGLAYLLQRQQSPWQRVWTVLGYIGSYAGLFYLVYFLCCRLDFSAHITTLMLLFENGMSVHFLLVFLLLGWGIVLLKTDCGCSGKSRGWLLLVLPCPVCFAVILASASFLNSMRPDDHWIFAGLGAGFIALGIITAFFTALVNRQNGEHGLGWIMVAAALYFLLTIILVPQFSDAARIYRLGLVEINKNSTGQPVILFTGLAIVFAVGFWRDKWRLTCK